DIANLMYRTTPGLEGGGGSSLRINGNQSFAVGLSIDGAPVVNSDIGGLTGRSQDPDPYRQRMLKLLKILRLAAAKVMSNSSFSPFGTTAGTVSIPSMMRPKGSSCVSVLLLVAAGLQGSAQATSPTRTPAPRVLFSDTSRLGRPFAKDPSVVKFKGRFLMYYSLPPAPATARGSSFEGAGWGIGIAASPDLIHWTKIGELPPSGGKERNGIAAPGARVVD